MEITMEISNAVLKEAIELRISDCFGAMQVANAIGGTPTLAWNLVNQQRLASLVEEALDRGLPVSEFRSAVERKPITDCRCYARLRDEIGGRPDFPK